jgi:hypothetical protein
LTDQLRWTLLVAEKEILGDASQRGAMPCDFKPISWARWMELLELQSLNAAKTRLARLEAMGLLEVQPGQRGLSGTTPNRYRLRWANDWQAATRTFHAVLDERTRRMGRHRQAGKGMASPVDTPGYHHLADTPKHQPADTPRVSAPAADTPSSEGTELNASVLSQSVNGLITELNRLKKLTDGLTDLILNLKNIIKNIQSVSQSVPVSTPQNKEIELIEESTHEMPEKTNIFDSSLKAFLKPVDPKPWPETLLLELGKILDPLQVAVIEERSPWSGYGAWAIQGAIATGGRNLGNQPGTLWNALVRQEKGARWLAQSGPLLPLGRGRQAPEQGCSPKDPAPAPRKDLFRPQADSPPMSWQGAVVEGDVSDPSEPLANEDENSPYLGAEDARETKDPLSQPNPEPITRPEDFSPEVKAELRTSIETFRNVTRAALRSPVANRPGTYDDFSRCWKHIVEVLEPMLPLKVNLPDEYRPVAIRQPSQIKMNVVNALYRAVS